MSKQEHKTDYSFLESCHVVDFFTFLTLLQAVYGRGGFMFIQCNITCNKSIFKINGNGQLIRSENGNLVKINYDNYVP